MPSYPETIARCYHIKVDGTQCASPALRSQKFCYFHKQSRQKQLQSSANIHRERKKVTITIPQDKDSLRLARLEVMRLLAMRKVDRQTADLMLYALRTASASMKSRARARTRPLR